MSKIKRKEQFVTRCQDARILVLTPAQNKAEVFISINGNRINIDNSHKTKTNKERKKLKWLKKNAKKPIGQTIKYTCI